MSHCAGPKIIIENICFFCNGHFDKLLRFKIMPVIFRYCCFICSFIHGKTVSAGKIKDDVDFNHTLLVKHFFFKFEVYCYFCGMLFRTIPVCCTWLQHVDQVWRQCFSQLKQQNELFQRVPQNDRLHYIQVMVIMSLVIIIMTVAKKEIRWHYYGDTMST